MKKIKLISFIAVLGLLFASCKTDIVQPVVSSNPTAPTGTTLTYTGTFDVNHRDSLLTFSWTAANFGFESSTTYYVQFTPDSSFTSNVATIITTQNLSGTAKVSDINTLILSWKFAIGTPVKVYFRVAASVSSKVDTVFSSAGSTTLTPYDAVINYPMIYVPGDYQGWAPGGDPYSRLYSYGFNSQYSSIVRLDNGVNATTQFKITSDPDWNHTNWGGTLTQSGNNYSGTLDPTGNNYQVNAACYVINADVSALTVTFTKTDDWGIIGSSIPPYDWSVDVNMNYNGQRQMWEITGDFKAGQFKFRANNDWSVNYGSNNNDGTLQAGGNNLNLDADGNYTIRFDPVALTYTIIKN
jgi:starch-binding outer membrane protein SusE/F